MDFLFKPHSLQGVDRTLFTLRLGNACNRQRNFNVSEHRLMGNEIVGLEYEPDAVVSIHVPIVILIILRRLSANDKVARSVLIQAANDVEHRRFTAPRRA